MADSLIFGTCQFCGQTQTIKASETLEGDAANEYITRHCKCDGASKFRRSEQIRPDIEYILGPDSEEYGYVPQSLNVVDLLENIAHGVFNESIERAIITLECGDTVSIKMGTDGAIRIMRIKHKERITPDGPFM